MPTGQSMNAPSPVPRSKPNILGLNQDEQHTMRKEVSQRGGDPNRRGLYHMRWSPRSPLDPLDGGISADYDSLSEASFWTTRSSLSSPVSSVGAAKTCISTSKPALSGSFPPLLSSSFLSDFKLSVEDRLDLGSEVSELAICPGESAFELTEAHGTSSLAHSLSKLEGATQLSDNLATQTASAMNPTAFAQTLAGEEAKQPWRRYWPPVPGSPEYLRIASRRPDVLSFSHDPSNHLLSHNHPWQNWKTENPVGLGHHQNRPSILQGRNTLRRAFPHHHTNPVSCKISTYFTVVL